MKDRRVEGEKVRSLKRRLKASIPRVQSTFHLLHDIRNFAVFTSNSALLRSLQEARRALSVPHAMGPLAARGIKK